MKFFQRIIDLFKRKAKEPEQVKQLTKIEIIDYVVDYFQKNPRAKDGTKCLYLTKTGLRCGHSICLEDDFVKNTPISRSTNAEILINEHGDDIHKPEFRSHDSDFWMNIQRIHDNNYFWRDNELTDDGKEFVKELKQEYSN